MKIGSLEVGTGHPCACIAEIGNAHNQSFARAIRLLDAAKAAGASAAKLQAYTVAELIALRGDGTPPAPWDHMTMSELYGRAMTPFEWFPRLFAHAASIGLPIFSSVFGLESLKILEDVGNPCYKIARLDRHHEWLVSAAAAMGKPVIVSTEDPDDITYLGAPVVRILCPSGYPVERGSFRIPCAVFGEWGLSSHCMDPSLPVAAVARGAKLLEYHFQLDDEPSELEQSVSLTASQFRGMVDDVRATEDMIGL